MSKINISIEGGESKRLLTAGKYCDRDIVVTASGGSGEVGSQVGEFTQYAKFIATPESALSFTIVNPLGGIAKKVFIRRVTTEATSTRKIQDYIADTDFGFGVLEAIDTSGVARYAVRAVSGSPNNGEFSFSDGTIKLYRFNSANAWDSANPYEVEIYQ